MRKLAKKIVSAPKLLMRKYQAFKNNQRLERISNEVQKKFSSDGEKVRILLAPSFAVFHTLKIHDILLSAALKVRGAKLGYLSAPFGLPFCKDCANITQFLKTDATYCTYCQRFQRNDSNLTQHLIKYSEIFSAEDFVGPSDLEHLKKQIENLGDEQLENFSHQGLPLGQYALDILRNQGYVGDVKLVTDYLEKVRQIILAQMVYYHYLKRALENFKPDVIVSHDSFYSPWRLLHDLAKKQNIPFYNYYPGLRHNTFHYDKDKISLILNIDPLFEKWRNRKIKETELKKLDKILANRKKGKIYYGAEKWIENNAERATFEKLIKSGKPLAALYGNVLWDLATLNREVVFDSVQETFLETVRFFIEHPEYNLVIKPHPGELISDHESQEKLADSIKAKFNDLPENILILHPKSSITAYDLFPVTNLSIVYTSTVGVESVIRGTPAITLGKVHYRGKGFTLDPNSPEQFVAMLKETLRSKDEAQIKRFQDQAKKYYYLYFFVYFHDYDIIKFDLHEKSTVTPKNLEALLAKKNFMKVVDAITNNQPIPYFDEGIEYAKKHV